MRKKIQTLLWRLLALLFLLLGIIGAVLPVMPTVPFVLVAAWAASHGWPQLEVWLLEHKVFGPPIREWRRHGAVYRHTKWIATVMMSCSAILIWWVPLPPSLLWVRWALPLFSIAVLTWLWLRPEPIKPTAFEQEPLQPPDEPP